MDLNNNENYILSICIPTFNRVNSLRKLLEQLLTLNDLSGIEYCISNNCSSDDTEELIYEFQKLIKIKYEKQNTNIGSSFNIRHVISMATGKYIVTIGDDDLICLENLKNIYKKLQLSDGGSWIFLSEDIDSQISYSGVNLKYFLFKKTLKNFGFMGAHMIPKKLYEKISLEKKYYLGWPHIAIMLKCILRKDARLELWPEVLVLQAEGDKAYYWTPDESLEILIIRYLLLRKFSIKIFDFYWLMSFREIYNSFFIGITIFVRLFGASSMVKSNKFLIKNLVYKWYDVPFIIPACLINAIIYFIPNFIFKYILPDLVYSKMLYLSSKLNNTNEYSIMNRGL